MSRIGYVVKVYPRFSETFVVTEILGRESLGDDVAIYALRPTTDSRFHPELARVKAPVAWISRPHSANRFWTQVSGGLVDAEIAQNFVEIMPQLAQLPASDVAQAVALAKQLKADGITHIHAHFASLAGRMAWAASKLTGIGYTVTTHAKDIFHEDVDKQWLRRICGDADNVIAISEFNRDYLESELEGTHANVVLQYNALELERFPLQHKALREGSHDRDAQHEGGEAFTIAAVGRLVPKKGFAHLVDAVAQLVDKGHRVHLKLAGEGELASQLEAQVSRLGLTHHVELLGPLTQAEVTELNASADVFVAPCIPSDDGNIDGLPTVVLEAMATGTPVIATSVTGLPEVVRDWETGLLIKPADTQALVEAIEAMVLGHVDSTALARNARKLIEKNFDNRIQARNLSKLQSRKQEV